MAPHGQCYLLSPWIQYSPSIGLETSNGFDVPHELNLDSDLTNSRPAPPTHFDASQPAQGFQGHRQAPEFQSNGPRSGYSMDPGYGAADNGEDDGQIGDVAQSEEAGADDGHSVPR